MSMLALNNSGTQRQTRPARQSKKSSNPRNRLSIANYTTEIEPKQTASEIQDLLIRANATAILYDVREGELLAISFKFETKSGRVLAFRLPLANVEAVYEVLRKSPQISGRLQTRDQAKRVAWRILLDWMDAILAMLEARMVEFEEVFLPYAQNAEGKTVYELMREQDFGPLLLKE